MDAELLDKIERLGNQVTMHFSLPNYAHNVHSNSSSNLFGNFNEAIVVYKVSTWQQEKLVDQVNLLLNQPV